jgi:beta-phosphoglucomutase
MNQEVSRMNEIKGVIFDMDGVLIDARNWHYSSLNDSLNLFGFQISNEDHLEYYDGLPTRKKLEILSEMHKLPTGLHHLINACKQEITFRYIHQYCFPKPNILAILSYCKNMDLKIGLATNSIRKTTEVMMQKSGLISFFDVILTNEDVKEPKPSPEIYFKAQKLLGLSSTECLVFEDNKNGIEAAIAAGCRVSQVLEPDLFFLDQVTPLLENKL